jgi:hypothetical protein
MRSIALFFIAFKKWRATKHIAIYQAMSGSYQKMVGKAG